MGIRKRTVSAVRIDGLEETEGDPDVDGEDVQVAAEHGVQDGADNRAGAEDEDLCGVGVLSGETERCRVLVVDLVDVLVEGSPVKSLVRCKIVCVTVA